MTSRYDPGRDCPYFSQRLHCIALMTPAAKRTKDGMLLAIPPHLTRTPKRRRRTNYSRSPRSRPSSPLSLPPMSSPDPEKCEDTNLGISSGTKNLERGHPLAIGTEVTSLEEITPSSDGPSAPSALDQKVSALEDKIDTMQTKMTAFEKDTEVLKQRLASLEDQLVALEKVTQTPVPSLQSMIVDEVHKIILASQTALLACINTYILGPLQKLKF
ncbi:hypothetical protein J3R83DRAFT_13942 [Lanmaoa asiatica]|nr:hypothetical protein J3R83DRAFT_13942 [Lanmaoa asiatica]